MLPCPDINSDVYDNALEYYKKGNEQNKVDY